MTDKTTEALKLAEELILESHTLTRKELEALVAAHEREACAKVCEEIINEETVYVWIPDAKSAVTDCAAAIRARGEK